MRVVVAPDKFAGTLTAPQVARVFARGWASVRPGDTVDQVPLSDGGPGFVECLRAALGGELLSVTVTGPMGDPVGAQLLLTSTAGVVTAYVEAAQANGLHLVPEPSRDPLVATTAGVGELVAAAIAAGASTVVVGLGGSATNDGGAGMLAALGAGGRDTEGAEVSLRRGPAAFGRLGSVDLGPALAAVRDVRIVVATDVDSPLLGPDGASHGFGAQKGADEPARAGLERELVRWRDLCAAGGGSAVAEAAGAGAAGGLGYGFLVVGAQRVPGIDTVVAAVGLEQRCAGAGLVVTGEGRFDWQSLHGKVVSGVVGAAAGAPVVVVAGQVSVPEARWRAAGFIAVRSLAEQAGSVDRAIADAAGVLESLAVELAAEWRPDRR